MLAPNTKPDEVVTVADSKDLNSVPKLVDSRLLLASGVYTKPLAEVGCEGSRGLNSVPKLVESRLEGTLGLNINVLVDSAGIADSTLEGSSSSIACNFVSFLVLVSAAFSERYFHALLTKLTFLVPLLTGTPDGVTNTEQRVYLGQSANVLNLRCTLFQAFLCPFRH